MSDDVEDRTEEEIEIEVLRTEMVPLDSLRPHPKNYRKHPEDQLEHLAQSIREHGFYRNVVVAQDGTVLAGHGVVEASHKLGLEEIPVTRIALDADSPRALKILAGDNTVSNLADDDDRALAEILRTLNEEDSLLGTGFDQQMLANFLMITRPASEIQDMDTAAAWVGMPEFEAAELDIFAKVRFLTEEDRKEFLVRLEIPEGKVEQRGSGYSFWWPFRERNDLSSLQFLTDTGEEEAAE